MLTLLAGFAVAPVVFVSPSGNDQAPGTEKRPLQTLPPAVARLRRQHAGGRIVLKPGDYPISATIELGPADGGIVIVSEKPNAARLLGGRILKKWKPASLRGMDSHVMVCDLERDEPIRDLGQMTRSGFSFKRPSSGLELFFDAQPMPLARYPNSGWLLTGDKTADQTVVYDGDRPKRWRSTDDVWAMGYWQYDWAETYERVSSLDPSGFKLADKPPFGAGPKRRFVFLNAIEELDAPGEWYLDRPAHKLYFWPPSGQGEAIASTLVGPMFRLKDASGITLKNLNLEVGRGTGVTIEGGKDNRVEGCTIRDFGLDGITIDGATYSGVAHCKLTGMGDRGITLRGGDRKTLTPARLYAEDNEIWAFSRWSKTYQPGIAIDGVSNRARFNRIHDAPHNAILLSGNNHVIEGNDIFRVCTETGDAGAVYMGRNPTMRGTLIRGNYFHDLGAKVTTEGNFTEVMSVYLDDGYCGTRIEKNLFEGPGTGIMLGGGQDNVVEGNLFVGKHPAVHLDARCRGWAKDMVTNPKQWNFLGQIADVDATHGLYAQSYPRLKDVLERGFGEPSGTVIASNLILVAEGEAKDWLRLQDGLSDAPFKNNTVQVADARLTKVITGEMKKVLPTGPRNQAAIPTPSKSTYRNLYGRDVSLAGVAHPDRRASSEG